MIRVLLADDHEIVRAGLRLLVDGQADMRVVAEAATGEDAVLAVERTAVDVAVLDLTMPGQGGLAAARRLKEAGAAVRIVVLTRHEDPAYVRELLQAGCAGYVLKQSASDELLQAIRAAARGEAYLDRALAESAAHAADNGPARSTLTNRERDVIRLAALGQSNKEIAAQLAISIKTVEVHKTNGMRKLQLVNRADMVRYAVVQGWMKDP